MKMICKMNGNFTQPIMSVKLKGSELYMLTGFLRKSTNMSMIYLLSFPKYPVFP